jgi:hypothetical protein
VHNRVIIKENTQCTKKIRLIKKATAQNGHSLMASTILKRHKAQPDRH